MRVTFVTRFLWWEWRWSPRGDVEIGVGAWIGGSRLDEFVAATRLRGDANSRLPGSECMRVVLSVAVD